MIKTYLIKLSLLAITLITFSSCSVVGGIFKTGMGVGVIMVIAVIGLIIFAISRSGKK